MATQNSCPESEIKSSQSVEASFQEAPDIDLFTESTALLNFYDNSQMADHPAKKSHNFGSSWKTPESEWASKYSHEETRPEKMQESIQDLHHNMRDSLQRLQNLEVKLKNGAGKRKKKMNKTDARKNAELEKVLYEMMKDAKDNPSK